MQINELKAIHKIQQKGYRPIYLGYIKPKSGKRSVGYMDPLVDFMLYKISKSQDPNTNPRAISPVWDRNRKNFNQDRDYDYMVKLKKPDTGGETYVYVEDVFIQDPKKYERIKVLYGTTDK